MEQHIWGCQNFVLNFYITRKLLKIQFIVFNDFTPHSLDPRCTYPNQKRLSLILGSLCGSSFPSSHLFINPSSRLCGWSIRLTSRTFLVPFTLPSWVTDLILCRSMRAVPSSVDRQSHVDVLPYSPDFPAFWKLFRHVSSLFFKK